MTHHIDEIKINIKDVKESNQSPKISETLLNTDSQYLDIKYISENSCKQNDELPMESSLQESQYPYSSLEKSNIPQENENSSQKLDKDYFLEADKYLEMYLDKKKTFQSDQFPRYGISEASTQTNLTMREIDNLEERKTISDRDFMLNIFQKSPDFFAKIYSRFVYENIVFDCRRNISSENQNSKDLLQKEKEPKSTDTFSLSKNRKNSKKNGENNLSITSSQKIVKDLDLSMNSNQIPNQNYSLDDREREKLISRKRKNPLNYYDFNKNGMIYKNGFDASFNNGSNIQSNLSARNHSSINPSVNFESLTPIQKNFFTEGNNKNLIKFQTKIPNDLKVSTEDLSSKNKNKILIKKKVDNRRKNKIMNQNQLKKPHLHFSNKIENKQLSAENSKSRKLENIRKSTQVNFKSMYQNKEQETNKNLNLNVVKDLNLNENFDSLNENNSLKETLINPGLSNSTNNFSIKKAKKLKNGTFINEFKSQNQPISSHNNLGLGEPSNLPSNDNSNMIPFNCNPNTNNILLPQEKSKKIFNSDGNNINSNLNLITPSNIEDFSKLSNVDNSFLKNNTTFPEQLANDLNLNQNNSSFLSFDFNNEMPQNFSDRSLPVKIKVNFFCQTKLIILKF